MRAPTGLECSHFSTAPVIPWFQRGFRLQPKNWPGFAGHPYRETRKKISKPLIKNKKKIFIRKFQNAYPKSIP